MDFKNLFIMRYRVKNLVGVQESFITASDAAKAREVAQKYLKGVAGELIGVKPAVVASEDVFADEPDDMLGPPPTAPRTVRRRISKKR